MTIKRINDNTISCTISPEDLRANGIELDDLFDRKKEAVDFIRQTVAQVAISENFDLRGDLTTMRISVLPDRSLNLLITREDTKEGAAREVRRIARSIFDSIASRAAENAGGQDNEQEGSASESLMKSLLAGISESSEEKSEDGQEKKQLPMAGDTFMFSFFSVRDAMDCCRVFADAGPVESSLYYLREDDTYFLIVHRTEDTPAGFEKCVLSANEFGELVTSEEQYIAFVTEHGDCVAKDHAIEMFMNVIPGIGENVIDGKKTRKRHKKDAVSAENTPSSIKKKDDPEEA